MAIGNAPLYAFNRGLISKLGLARTDLKRNALSAEVMENWMPRVLGSMMLRPGLAYKAGILSDLPCQVIPFIRSSTDTAIIEMTSGIMRVFVNEVPISRVSVATAVTNGTFNSNLSGWTLADESGAASTWVTGGWAGLQGTGTNRAIMRQTVTVAGGDQGKEHALEINIRWGPLTLRVGTADGLDDYVEETLLAAGRHSIAFTPTGNIHIEMSNNRAYGVLVDSIVIASAGDMKVVTPFGTNDLPNLRWAQSADVIFIAWGAGRPMKIERRSTTSWSCAFYIPEDGPFRLPNIDPGLLLNTNATTGTINLTANRNYFDTDLADDPGGGALFRLNSQGQDITSLLGGLNQATDPPVKVTGLSANSGRVISITISGTWVGNIQLQRSVGAPGAWATAGKNFTSNVTGSTFNDGLDNQIIFYRLIFTAYTSGTATAEIQYSAGSVAGIVLIEDFLSTTVMDGLVMSPFGGTDATSSWNEGEWSDRRGWPTAVSFVEGRLGWCGNGEIWCSVSDAYASFDDTVVGDSGPINRVIAGPSTDAIQWMLALQRLIVGTEAAEHVIKSSSFDEILTPANFNVKEASTQGSLPGSWAVKVDSDGYFIQKSGQSIFKVTFNWTLNSVDYVSTDATVLCPDLGLESNYKTLYVQRKPDTRIHAIRADGSAALLVTDPAEEVNCLLKITTPNGVIENCVVLPSTKEDAVYYVVKRTINGVTKRYLERWAREDECQGGTLSKQLDSHIVYQGAATTTITGLTTLQGQSVMVWGDGKAYGPFTVSGGQITGLPVAVSNAVVGIPYQAPFQSTKLAYAAQMGTALTQRKKVNKLGFILYNTHAQGLQFGPDANHLNPLPLIESGAPVDQNSIWPEYDKDPIEFPGDWSTDSRIYLLAQSPYPVTLLAAVIQMETRERA